jgi:hypothetical protein
MPLTVDELKKTVGTLGFRRSVIALVCRPEIAQRVRDIAESSDLPSLGIYGDAAAGVEVLTDNEQSEACIAFYDRESLRVYLARFRRCASTGCEKMGARWWHAAEYFFYCDDCAQRILMSEPDLPGFSQSRLVKI